MPVYTPQEAPTMDEVYNTIGAVEAILRLTSNPQIQQGLSNCCEELRKIPTTDMTPLEEDEIELLDRGKAIQAIKAYRERTGCRLWTAKNVVDHYRDER